MNDGEDRTDATLGKASSPEHELTEILSDTELVQGSDKSSASPADLTRGVSRRYRLGRVLGEGGMGVVYEATDLNLNRQVAVKAIRLEYADSAEMLDRFFHEAEILGAMDHPGLLAVYECGVLPQGGGPFYAMKQVRGRTLQQINKDRLVSGTVVGGSVLSERVELFRKICETMAYAHAQGYIHRDLKPANIMIDEFGVVLVVDWGLAKRVSSQEMGHTMPGGVVGTPGYMSPEQAEGNTESVGFASDVFALGVILYELLTGERPYLGSSSDALREQIRETVPPGPRTINRRVPRALAAICMKALAKETHERYADAGALADDIMRYQCHMPTRAYKRRLPDHLAAFAARKPALAATVATCLLLALLLASGFSSAVAKEVLMRQQTADTITRFLEESQPVVSKIEERVLGLHNRLAHLSPAEEKSRAQVTAELAELETAKEAYTEFTRVVVASLLARTQRELAAPMQDIDPDLADHLRHLRLSHIDNLIAEGELYEAHHELHRALNEPMGVTWSEEEKADLRKRMEAVEADLRKTQPDGFVLPDWDAYDPSALMRRIAEESGLL